MSHNLKLASSTHTIKLLYFLLLSYYCVADLVKLEERDLKWLKTRGYFESAEVFPALFIKFAVQSQHPSLPYFLVYLLLHSHPFLHPHRPYISRTFPFHFPKDFPVSPLLLCWFYLLSNKFLHLMPEIFNFGLASGDSGGVGHQLMPLSNMKVLEGGALGIIFLHKPMTAVTY